MPGEISQELGRAYVQIFGGCLERTVKGFRQVFDVYKSPEKLTFKGFSGTKYSFDLQGYYQNSEVFVESKGYQDGSGLMEAYKEFFAKAYCTSVLMEQHQRDHFWFVTNVPFGSSFGRRLWSFDFILESLCNSATPRVASIIG